MSLKQIMAGQYQITIVGLDEFGKFTDHKVIGNVKLPLVYIRAVSTFASSTHFNHHGRLSITGYTSCKMNINTKDATLQATSNYGNDGQWYDWCLAEWVDHNEQCNTYPGKILGFFNLDNTIYALIQLSIIPITIEQLIDKFVCSFVLDHHRQTEIVKIDTIRTILCVFKNYGGPLNLYFCVLPTKSGDITVEKKLIPRTSFPNLLRKTSLRLYTAFQYVMYVILPSPLLSILKDTKSSLLATLHLCPSSLLTNSIDRMMSFIWRSG